ncbi:hypothetical protein C5Y96_15755 [Blastopirellula marina]|uniref:Uncharacterized protein n=1 Tax=Blastopirellula marina TaxID=124 RepID=A0A2S8FAM3_9BACT|nr:MULTISPECIES: hypothetical protein [Pirellulaceae]PQO29201.1 hypothetical protein C5Y96_15755 [Blastopirellula marina]RCS50394.1 hypothetical protein DTL36_15775 [Bremerella cremea]
MARAIVAIVSVLFLSIGGCSFGPPTPEQMKQMVIGQWAANSSAIANAARAMKISSQNPGASPSEATAAGRAMGNMALEFREDGAVLAAFQNLVLEGTWTFDAENTMVEMDLTQTPPLPEGQAEPSKTAWVAILDPEKQKMQLFMFNREAYNFFQTMDEKTKKNSVIFRLEKKS